MPLSCPSSCPIHGPNGCNCIPSQGQRYHDERSQLHQPTPPVNAAILTSHPGPLACAAPAAFTSSYIHFPDLHGSGYGTIAFSQHSDSQLNVPSQCLSFPLAPPAEPPEQNSGDGMATPNLTRKGKRKSTATKSNPQQPPRKRPRIPAVPTTEPPSSICGVGPPTTVEAAHHRLPLHARSHLVAKEEGYAIDHATEEAIQELISLGNIEELRDLLNSMDENWE
ncbi:hypothetical protein BGW80DRAFT_1250550 [Lactifluus volemus]|nr:hypothetical protein BGW80DRAFT_1250550 [Lactifluus volemus]